MNRQASALRKRADTPRRARDSRTQIGISAPNPGALLRWETYNSGLTIRKVVGAVVEIIYPLHFDRELSSVHVEVKGEAMGAQKIELPQGTLDLLILRTVALEPQHGWAISERIHQISSEVLQVRQGSLYPALHRLERRGWIKAKWGASENNRKAKYYELTRAGRRQLEEEKDAWEKLTTAVAQVLGTA